jgi:hypothetical protein
MGVVPLKSATRAQAAEPGAGAKPRLTELKADDGLRFVLPRLARCRRLGDAHVRSAKTEGGVGSGFASPAPKPRGFGLRLRAKRKDGGRQNKKPSPSGWHAQRLCDGRGAAQVGDTSPRRRTRGKSKFP